MVFCCRGAGGRLLHLSGNHVVKYIEVTCLCRGGWRGMGMGCLSSDNNRLLDWTRPFGPKIEPLA